MGARRPPRRVVAFLPLVVGLGLSLAACSPESSRGGRGGSEGADVGNRDADVQLQGDLPPPERIYYDTPRKLPTDDR